MQNATQNLAEGLKIGNYLGASLHAAAGLLTRLSNPRNLRPGELMGRVCTGCLEGKPADSFNLRCGPRKDGTRALYPLCRTCVAAQSAASYRADREASLAASKLYRKKHIDRYRAYDANPERRKRRVSQTRTETCRGCGMVGGAETFVVRSTWGNICPGCRKADTAERAKTYRSLLTRLRGIHKRALDKGNRVCVTCGYVGEQGEFYASRVLQETCSPCRETLRRSGIASGHKTRQAALQPHTEKTCTRCKTTKAAGDFRVIGQGPGRPKLNPTCKPCTRLVGAEARAKLTEGERQAQNKLTVAARKSRDAPKAIERAAARLARNEATAQRTEKACSLCGVTRALDFFTKIKKSLDGHGSSCKPCQAECASTRRALDPVGYLEKMAARNTKNPDKVRSRVRVREAAIAHPAWSDSVEIRAVYAEAAAQRKRTGEPYAVDHIYPLTSDMVCGLHVACNLRVVPSRLNAKKLNKLPGFLAHELWDPTASNVFHEGSTNE